MTACVLIFRGGGGGGKGVVLGVSAKFWSLKEGEGEKAPSPPSPFPVSPSLPPRRSQSKVKDSPFPFPPSHSLKVLFSFCSSSSFFLPPFGHSPAAKKGLRDVGKSIEMKAKRAYMVLKHEFRV